jgi:hypothetical protein
MSQLFERFCQVTVGTIQPLGEQSQFVQALQFSGLRCEFKIKKGKKQEPNTMELKVTNLSREHRAAIQQKGLPVILAAGYAEDFGIIFSGDARTVDSVHEGADWNTLIQCGDGERAFRFARLNKSYAAGTPVATVALDLVSAMGLNAGNAAQKLSGISKQYVSGYVVTGQCSAELAKVLRPLGLGYSIQDGAVQILAEGEGFVQSIPLLSPDTGLIGSPEHGAPATRGQPTYLKVKSLLRPAFKPGGHVQIRSEGTNGQFLIHSVTHTGDTAGGAWYSELEVT